MSFTIDLNINLCSNRDRNREHAKNTRLRKKCYVKKLQELVDRMNAQKELEERERKALGQRIYDTVLVAYRMT